MKNYKKIRLIIQIIVIIIIIISLLYFIKRDLVLSGELEYKSDFRKKLPMISVLYPEHRTTKDDNGFVINETPIYFDFRSPIKFDNAEIKINFKNTTSTNIILSVKNNNDEWAFTDYYLFEKNKDIPNNNFVEKSINIDLENAKIENGNLKFMISVPDISNTDEKPIIKSVIAKLYLNEKRGLFKSLENLLKDLYNSSKLKILKLKNKL